MLSELSLAQIDRMRQPRWKIFVYDIRSTGDTLNDIVLGNVLDPDTGPREFSVEAREIQFTENASDYVDGLGSQIIDVTITDAHGAFDPLTGDDGNWIRQGNVVRILEGDARVDQANWVWTFTGEITGQAGVLRSRAIGSGESWIKFRAYDRSARFFKYKRTSEDFGQGTPYISMAINVAQNDMGLDLGEIDFSAWGSNTTGHTSTQFVDEEPLVSIAKAMFVDGVLPFFDGEGRLTQTDGNIFKAPSRVYEDFGQFQAIERPMSEDNPINRVYVVGLSDTMTEIAQPQQVLATASITTGYFTSDESFPMYFSDDQSVVAKNVELNIIKSVNGGLNILGGGEEWEEITIPGGEIIGIQVSMDTGFAPYVIIFLTAVYVLLAVIPDTVLPYINQTVSVGRLIQAGALAGVLFLMTKIGRGEYEALGEPYEYVFEEIRACAQVALTPFNERNEITIENHLVQNQDDANECAKRVLLREQAKGNARAVPMFHDLVLLPDDKFETPDGREYMIKSIQRTLSRDEQAVIANVDCFETTPGVTP
jgi:hypothetical protein